MPPSPADPTEPTTRESRPGLRRAIGLALGALAFAAFAFAPSELHRVEGFGSRPAYAAGVATLMAIWWFTECVPIALTACVPLVLYPALGVFGKGPGGDLASASGPYVDAYIFLFLGGMLIGAAMERWDLHRRIALHVMLAVGTSPRRLLLGIIVATAGVSLWISNTATAVMMLPIALALLQKLEEAAKAKLPGFASAVVLAVAYASNVGGIGTKIGTGTNSIFVGFTSTKLQRDLGFLEYMVAALPFVVGFVPIVWGVLWLLARRDVSAAAPQGRELLQGELDQMGRMSANERKVAMAFGIAALLWIAGDPLRSQVAPRVLSATGFAMQAKHWEASVALGAAGGLAAVGALRWESLRRVPWGTLVLLGGSFAMAAGIEGSGLSRWLAGKLAMLASLPLAAQVGIATAASIGLSAVASNTATINVLLNVLPQRLSVLFAATVGASCDFMLPAGTPPNAIVFGSGRVRLATMMRTGFVLDLLAAVGITLYVLAWADWALGS